MKKILIALSLLCACLGASWAQQNNHWTTYNVSNSDIGGNTILALATDNNNNLWVGSNLGLCKLSGRNWTDYAMFNEKLKDQFVNCLTVDPQGHLWIGTDDYGVIEFDGSHWTEYSKETKKLNMKFVRDIAIDRRNVKWIGVTLSGLVKDDNTNNWQKFTADNSQLLSDFILCVAIDKDNRKWVGTNEGLCLYDDQRWTSYTTSNSDLPSNNVPAVIIDKKDVKWVGTLGGLCRFDGRDWTVFNTDNSPLPSNQVNSLAQDEGGAIWIATDRGVAVFDGTDSWHVYPQSRSTIPSNMVQKLVVDGKGNKWFGTDFQGLVRFSGQGIQGKVTDDQGRPKFGVSVRCGDLVATTDAQGEYYFEVPTGATVTVQPVEEGSGTYAPASRRLETVRSHQFHQDFVISTAVEVGKKGEKVMINPYLDQGYITITLESRSAEVEFVNADGVSVRTIPNYISGNRITISKMPKGMYNLYIRTDKGEKSLRFNLR